jgi:hypothetical protein
MKKSLAAAVVLLATVAPRGASAQSIFSTFLDRSAYLAAAAGAANTNHGVVLDPTVYSPTMAGPATVATVGSCGGRPLTYATGPTYIAFANQDDTSGAFCPIGGGSAIVFGLSGQRVRGFGFDLSPLQSFFGPINLSVSTAFNGSALPATGANPGINPVTYTFPAEPIPAYGAPSFFGVLLQPGIPFPPGATEIVSVTVTTNTLFSTSLASRFTYATATPASTVPEPATVALFGGGLALLGGMVARRRRR